MQLVTTSDVDDAAVDSSDNFRQRIDLELDPAVLLAPVSAGVRRQRIRRAVPDDEDAIECDTLRHEVASHRERPLLGKRLVESGIAGVVSMSVDGNQAEPIVRQDARDARERRLCAR